MQSAQTSCPGCKKENIHPFRVCPYCRFPLMEIAGKYKTFKKLARGGMGTLYLARHARMQVDNTRVIKVIDPDMMDTHGVQERFYREIQVTAALSQRNEHIVRIYDDFGEEEGLGHYFVMEYLEGDTLTSKMKPGQPLATPLVFLLFSQLCTTLNAAHQQGIVHRDIKPDNILLIHRENHDHFVKVIDFGIARSDHATLMQLTRGIVGTPRYMSPEQCKGDRIDTRADIYALGILLYELLTGYNPYGLDTTGRERSGMAALSAHTSRQPIPLSHWQPSLKHLDPVLAKALAKSPNDRFETTLDLWQAMLTGQASSNSYDNLSMAQTQEQPFVSMEKDTLTSSNFPQRPSHPHTPLSLPMQAPNTFVPPTRRFTPVPVDEDATTPEVEKVKPFS